jgi:hypothetical protein
MAPEERTESGEPKPTLRDNVVIAELEAAREVAVSSATDTAIIGALNTLIGSKIALDDALPGEFDPSALLKLGGGPDQYFEETEPSREDQVACSGAPIAKGRLQPHGLRRQRISPSQSSNQSKSEGEAAPLLRVVLLLVTRLGRRSRTEQLRQLGTVCALE